jgi:hypothetical protein
MRRGGGDCRPFPPAMSFCRNTLNGNGRLYPGVFAGIGYRHLFPERAGVAELNQRRKQVPVPSALSVTNRRRRRSEARNDVVRYAGKGVDRRHGSR